MPELLALNQDIDAMAVHEGKPLHEADPVIAHSLVRGIKHDIFVAVAAEDDIEWTSEHTVIRPNTTETIEFGEAGHPIIACGRRGMSPESSYFLDGCHSCNDITTDVATFVRMAGFDLDAFLDTYDWRSGERPRDHSYNLMMCARTVRGHYLNWRSQATTEQRAACSLSLLYGIGEQFRDFAWDVSDNCVSSMLRREQKLDTLEGELQSRSYIEGTIRQRERINYWCRDVREGLGWLRADYAASDKGVLADVLRRYIENDMSDCVIYGSEMASQITATTITGQIPRGSQITRRKRKLVRQAIKRSSEMFRRVIGDNEVRAFMRGDPITLEGTLFNYVVKKNQSVIEHTARPHGGHIPYDLAVYDCETRERLCRICVYFSSTPVLDQIAGMALFIKSGEEEELLHASNMFDRCAEFDQHPTMQRLGKTSRGKANALGEVTGAQIDRLSNTIDTHFLTTFGVSGKTFNEEIVPWRARMRDPIIDVLGHMIRLPNSDLMRLVAADKRFDELTYVRDLPPTLDAFLANQFA
jgi:hypothetical protein